ncbi:hypothetical protein IOD16_31050 [Saccharothrix sp. 6-C]|uniref:hypothetical protein n=1 Tax=Saccharothrix sp. 6-C TaxID=2781735 RepID=UPI001916D8BF|nr:hypothetical protein [Saccharothrix sp. 6-C]QQQ75490.1 hypothetical protein IOD16_31050 [Saccharothrix sp. 6-C]
MVVAVVYVLTKSFGGWAHWVNRAAKYLIEGVVALIMATLVLGGLVLPHVLDASLGARDIGGPGSARLLGMLGLVGSLVGVFFWLRARRRKRSGS